MERGDVIICRDQSRLDRDAIEVTLVVRDRGCRLYGLVTIYQGMAEVEAAFVHQLPNRFRTARQRSSRQLASLCCASGQVG